MVNPIVRLVRTLSKAQKSHLHVICQCNLPLLVPDNWERELAAGDLIDVLDPTSMALDSVCGQTDQLGAALREFWLKLGESAELGRADWSVILWVGEKDDPVVADEIVEVDWAICGLSVEVWGNGAKTERSSRFLRHDSDFVWR